MKIRFYIYTFLALLIGACGEDNPVTTIDVEPNYSGNTKLVLDGNISNNNLCRGEVLEIYGKNFDKNLAALKVYFNKTRVGILSATNEVLKLRTPYMYDSVGQITVVAYGDTLSSEHTVRFNNNFCLNIDKLSKDEVSTGETITVYGEGFEKYDGVLTAEIDRVSLQPVITSDNECQLTIPSLSDGDKKIVFEIGGYSFNTLDIKIRYPFEVENIEPSILYRGDIFTITGSGFGTNLSDYIVLFECYTNGAFELAEITSLNDNKIAIKVPETAIIGYPKFKIILKGTELIFEGKLRIVLSNYDYKNVEVYMNGLQTEVHQKGVIFMEEIDRYEFRNISEISKNLTANTIWNGDSISWQNHTKNDNGYGNVTEWTDDVKIILDSTNKLVKYFGMKNRYDHQDSGHNSGSSGNEYSVIQLTNIPYVDLNNQIEITLDKNTIDLDKFNFIWHKYYRYRDYTEVITDYSEDSTGELEFDDDFVLTFRLSK